MNIWIFSFETAVVVGIALIVWLFLVCVVGRALGECYAEHRERTKNIRYSKNDYVGYGDNGSGIMFFIVTPLMLWLVYWILTEAVMPPEMAQSLRDFVHSIVSAQVK